MRVLLIITLGLLTACTTLATATPATHTPIPALTIMPMTAFPTATETPQATLIENCPAAPEIRLIIQERGLVSVNDPDPLNIRRNPGLNAEKLTGIQPGRTFFVLDGPVCADGYSWFRVRYRDVIGWIAEGDPELYYVEPYLTG